MEALSRWSRVLCNARKKNCTYRGVRCVKQNYYYTTDSSGLFVVRVNVGIPFEQRTSLICKKLQRVNDHHAMAR